MKNIKNRLTLKVFFLIIITDVLESVAELFFKNGATATGMNNIGLHNFLEFTFKILSVPSLWIGILIYAVNFFVWMIILSRIELSVAFPIGSTTYIIVPILSIMFLHEKVFLLRWVGILLIIIGVYFISKSTENEPHKDEP
ncbi:MAG: EamA family transporter [bacterium]|nr:EamA family transporter [bacterium]